ncbi:Prolyl 4-hydroxylase subunit alpha-1-like 4 [Homarus americanus]|uniref:Prolyl 4-hydroxylase subunit alpha-1-like 4 n=1 Tax=Homarus americanus TaxID=6706 RepID=A0A8J5N8U0_HOMAM|nr:Prolyl 4-hydroxylase subunit alpha-1-like 4 [Homarus americanus]
MYGENVTDGVWQTVWGGVDAGTDPAYSTCDSPTLRTLDHCPLRLRPHHPRILIFDYTPSSTHCVFQQLSPTQPKVVMMMGTCSTPPPFLLLLMMGVCVGVVEGWGSVEHLARAHSLDTIIVEHLKTYLRQHLQEVDLRNNFTRMLPTHLLQGVVKEVAEDPVLSLVTTRRLAKDWPVPLEVQKQEENKVLESQEMETSDVISSTPRDKQVLSLLCRGHTLLTASESSHLKCHVGSRGSPWLRLMPVKVEEHSLDPAILSFHDLFLPHQLAVLRQLSRPLLEQARVQGADKSLTYMYRSSYNAWLRGPTHPVVRAVNHMIAALTGLEMDEDKEEAELLQTNLYGAGGHYIPHMDFLALYRSLWESDNPVEKLMKEFPNGDRVATFMIYMNKVEEGGRTAFPRVGVSVEPREGSAVFWYNLLPSGKGDLRMLHAACPVLRGTKWDVPQTVSTSCCITTFKLTNSVLGFVLHHVQLVHLMNYQYCTVPFFSWFNYKKFEVQCSCVVTQSPQYCTSIVLYSTALSS